MMLLNFTLEELKMLSTALSNNNFDFIYEGSPLWELRKDYEALEDKINKELEYYEINK